MNTSYNKCEGGILVHKDIIFAACCGYLVFAFQDLTGCMTVVNLMLPRAEEMYFLFAQDSGWLVFLCCQELKECIYYLSRMAVIFMLPRAEENNILRAQDGCHFYAAKS